ncbi:hypothetical protein Tco_1511563 [Tanacetum coccineum]
MGPKRHPDATVGAPGVAQGAPIVDEGGQADPAPVQIRGMLAEQREVISAMAQDFSIFCTWTTTSLARMMDRADVTYTSYSKTPREYTRLVICRTGKASTSAAQQDPHQPDP